MKIRFGTRIRCTIRLFTTDTRNELSWLSYFATPEYENPFRNAYPLYYSRMYPLYSCVVLNINNDFWECTGTRE